MNTRINPPAIKKCRLTSVIPSPPLEGGVTGHNYLSFKGSK